MSDTALFHHDNRSYFDVDGLRAYAAEMVRASSLVRAAALGDRVAARVMHVGFWPFVREFELAIDRHPFPREPLQQKFAADDADRVRRTIVGLARAVRDMKEEEGSHAAHWASDARQLGLESLDRPEGAVEGVQRLVDSAYVADMPHFFAVLAGTELIAEEIAAHLMQAPAFTALFERGRWMWGEIHLLPHDAGPSHLEIDFDLARAYARGTPADTQARLRALVRDTIDLFARAALDVERLLLAPARAADAQPPATPFSNGCSAA